MPKPSRSTLIWSDGHQHYDLYSYGQPEQCFRLGDEAAFSCWLVEHSSFAFWGRAGRIFVLKEARRGGRGYWYAYHTQDRHTHKRYLGSSAQVTFARLEQEAKTLTSESSSASLAPASLAEIVRKEPRKVRRLQTEQRAPLLASRFSPPRLPSWLVERSRLLDELDVVLSRSLALVSASAGSGKTTLLSAWVAASKKRHTAKVMVQGTERAEKAMAWLSLDALDNDPIRFWTSVIAALRTCVPTLGQQALALLHAPLSPPLSTILLVLLSDILEDGRDLILILDDYHVIEDETIHEAMRFLIDHLPDTLHLVLATRTNPALPLSRLRALGQLLEIRHSDLRFTRAETASFLRDGMSLPLSAEDVTTLQQRTEGWIVGLHLAALSLHKREDPTSFVKNFAGSHRDLLGYVQQDVLARLPQDLQGFLLQTSIATRMNAAFCQALTALPTQKESQERLLEVERANLFVVPLDYDRQWYRYHDLFREALQARLYATHPELVPLLHQRAARFYEAGGELPEAIVHALTASDYLYAASLIEQAAPASWLCGEARTVLSWVLALPDTVLSAHLRLALGASLRLINSINLSNETQYASLRSQMERIFTRLEGILQRKPELAFSDVEVALIRRRLRLLWVLIEGRAILKRGDTERLKLLAEEIEALPQDEEVNWSIIPLTLTFWLKVYLQSEGASLIPQLLATKQVLMQTGDHLVTIRVRIMLAYAYTRAAQWSQAKQECLEVLAQIEQIDVYTIWSGYVYFNLLICSYAQNRLEEASRWLQHLLRSAQDWQQVELHVRGEICSVQLALVRGDLSTAQEALRRLETLVERDGYAYHVPWVSSLRVQYLLASRNLYEASQWAAQTTFSPEAWNPFRKEEVLMLVRVLLAQKHYSRAVETLERFREHLTLSADIKTSIEFLVLSVVALHFAGKRTQALGSAASLLQLSESEDFIRVLLDAGEAMKQILLTWLSAAKSARDEALSIDNSCAAVPSSEFPLSLSSILRWLSAFEQEERKYTLPPQSVTRQVSIEPLSQQEIRVLRLLVAGRTYAEMAEALIVSPNTIKTQVSNIYRKLGVSRRAEAIAVTAHAQLLL